MSVEYPEYGDRAFYGPLELSTEYPQNGDRYIALHPDDPTKLIRASSQGEYYDHNEMNSIVYATQQVLNGLSQYGVNHVNPVYIDQTSEAGKPYLITVVDKLRNVKSYSDLIEDEVFSDEQLSEIDHALCGMLDFTLQSVYEEGYISPEMMRLNQFVYDESQPPGSKMVLVDIEPRDGCKVDVNRDSMKYGYLSPLADTVAKLVVDTIINTNRASWTFASVEKAAAAIEALPGDSEGTINAKTKLFQALDSKSISQEVLNLLKIDEEDEDDWIFD
jgi:hypothetical protein